MKYRAGLYITLFLVFFCINSISLNAAPLKALIVTGQNNHKWTTSSPALKQILEETHLFTVDIAKSPESGADMSPFLPDFPAYDVVVLDYNGDHWPKKTQKHFVTYVKSGGGVVVFHAANNAFADWPEYNEIIGLGGWGARNETVGPYLYWQNGKLIRDDSPGGAGMHGPQSEFQVVARDTLHPIMRGLPTTWMHAKDELYSNLRGPAKNITVLATAYSNEKLDGSGRHEPVLFTVQYGKGRIFHTVLGHVDGTPPYPAIECAGFIVTLQRGAEWAATGDVTQSSIVDFPNAVTVRQWPEFRAPKFKDELKSIEDYKFAESRVQLARVVDMIAVASQTPQYAESVERELCKFLKSDATNASKQFVCRQLKLVGTDYCVPTLADLLYQPETFDMARYALERIPGEKTDKALRKALRQLDDQRKIGIIHALGNRGDVRAVRDISKLLHHENEMIVQAAAEALGEIADEKCVAALLQAKNETEDRVRLTVLHASLECADQFLKRGENEQALKIYNEIFTSSDQDAVRSAAFRGMIMAAPETAGEKILIELKGESAVLQKVAVSLVAELSDPKAIASITHELPRLSRENQKRLVLALARQDFPFVRQAVTALLDADDQNVRIAALQTLAVLGDETTVTVLARRAASTKGGERQAARQALYRMSGERINSQIISTLSDLAEEDTAQKLELIRAIEQRRIISASELLLNMSQKSNRKIRMAAAKALRIIADEKNVPELVQLLRAADSDAERREWERTVIAVAQKINSGQKSTAALEALQEEKEQKTIASLYNVLGKLGEKSSLPILTTALQDANDDLKRAAIIALSEWPDQSPKENLYPIAKSSDNQTHRILALRGYLRLIGLESDRSAEETCRLYEGAMQLTQSADDQKMVLAGLAQVKSLQALELASSYLEKAEVGDEAEAAVIKIAENINESFPNEAKTVLLQVIKDTENDLSRQNAQKVLNVIERLDDYITTWRLSGPYVNEEVNIFAFPFAPEDPNSKNVEWANMPENSDPQNYWYMDLRSVLGGNDRVAYLRTHIYSANQQPALLEMGSNDGVKAWFNGELIHVNDANRGATPGEDVVQVNLNAGENELLLKVVNGGGGWGACARFRRLDGGALQGVRIQLKE